MQDPNLYDFDPEIIEKSQYQIPHPELGPLERQIELTYEEALFEEEGFDQEHTNYWFTEPQGVCRPHLGAHGKCISQHTVPFTQDMIWNRYPGCTICIHTTHSVH